VRGVGVDSCLVDDAPQLVLAFARAIREQTERFRTVVRDVAVGACLVDDPPQSVLTLARGVRELAELFRVVVRFLEGLPKTVVDLPPVFSQEANDLGTSTHVLEAHPLFLRLLTYVLCDRALLFGCLAELLSDLGISFWTLVYC
jgi:hypothetical protein